MKTHFFLAIPVLQDVRAVLTHWKGENETLFPFQKWVHSEDLHITLVFLGDVEEETLEWLSDRLIEKVSQKHSPFHLTLNHLQTFGNSQRPRIFWAGVEQEKKLYLLQQDIVNVCKEVGIQIEKRPYHPHITLARRWKSSDNYSQAMADERFLTVPNLSWEVNHFHLYQSHLGKSPMYEPIRTFFLHKEE